MNINRYCTVRANASCLLNRNTALARRYGTNLRPPNHRTSIRCGLAVMGLGEDLFAPVANFEV